MTAIAYFVHDCVDQEVPDLVIATVADPADISPGALALLLVQATAARSDNKPRGKPGRYMRAMDKLAAAALAQPGTTVYYNSGDDDHYPGEMDTVAVGLCVLPLGPHLVCLAGETDYIADVMVPVLGVTPVRGLDAATATVAECLGCDLDGVYEVDPEAAAALRADCAAALAAPGTEVSRGVDGGGDNFYRAVVVQ